MEIIGDFKSKAGVLTFEQTLTAGCLKINAYSTLPKWSLKTQFILIQISQVEEAGSSQTFRIFSPAVVNWYHQLTAPYQGVKTT